MGFTQSLARLILRLAGWKVTVTVPDYPRCIICVAPHTSNWDFIIGKLAYASVGRKAGFLMKESWFFFPLGYFFRAIGGVAVPRKSKSGSLVEFLTGRFRSADRLVLAITPEGTRSLTDRWHTGFLRIAYATDVPVVLGAIDFARRTVTIADRLYPCGDTAADLAAVKRYYASFSGCRPELCSTRLTPEEEQAAGTPRIAPPEE